MVNRIFRDSTNPDDIPLGGLEGVMGYANGLDKWLDTGWRQFAGLPWARMDVLGTDPSADILDYEPGNVHDIASAENWVTHHHVTPQFFPIVYCDRVDYETLVTPLGSNVRYIVATLDGTIFRAAQVIGCQSKGEKQTGGHYDETVIWDDTWLPVQEALLVTHSLSSRVIVSRDRAHAIWR